MPERHGGERDDKCDRCEHRRRGELPARHGLQPEVHEEPVLDEVADCRRAEPEHRERHHDPEAVRGGNVRGGLRGVVVPAREDAEQDGQPAERSDPEQARHGDLRPQQEAVERADRGARPGAAGRRCLCGAHRCTR